MADIWFSSDLHLWHKNIIKFCNRPFEDEYQMNQALLTYHNMFVKPQDHWYNLGDITMRRGGKIEREEFINEIKRYHGHKRLLLGNHDHFPIKTYIEAGFEKIYATWRGIDNFILSHIPIHPNSMSTASANIHGHIHNNQTNDFKPVIQVWGDDKEVKTKPYINVSVEVINYRPVHLDELREMVKKACEQV